MKNYKVFDAQSKRVNPQPMTLKEAINEIRHASPFGIVNISTNRTILFHTQRGFFFPLKMVQAFEKRTTEIVKKYSHFEFHPQQ